MNHFDGRLVRNTEDHAAQVAHLLDAEREQVIREMSERTTPKRTSKAPQLQLVTAAEAGKALGHFARLEREAEQKKE